MTNNYAIIIQNDGIDDHLTMGFDNSTTQPTMEDNDMDENMSSNIAINIFDANIHPPNNVNCTNNNTNNTINSSIFSKKSCKLVQYTLACDEKVARELGNTKVCAHRRKSIKKSTKKTRTKAKKT